MLGYHKIGPPPAEWWSWQYVPGDVFAAQLEWMRGDGWEAIAADDLVRGLADPGALPPRSFLVTFDDAYRSLRDEALTQLERLGVPAVVFVPTDFVGGWNRFDHDVEPREQICDWETLRELSIRGISVQSHGATHRTFSDLTPAEQEREARASRELIESELGAPVELLAYPYGDAGSGDGAPERLSAAGYSAAFGYGGGAFSVANADRYRLPRLAMGPDTDIREELGL